MKPPTSHASSSKNPYGPITLIVLASLSWANVTLADETSAAGSSGGSQPSGPFRTGESTATSGSSNRSPFGYDSGASSSQAADTRKPDVEAVEGETAGAGAGVGKFDDNASNFVAPSFYGRAPQLVTPGRGEYARPKFRYGVSVGIGYDSNPNQVPDNNLTSVAQSSDGSGFVWLNGHWDAQWIKPRTVFTVNVQGGGNFFFDAADSATYNAQIGAFFVHKINPRTQFSANVSLAFLPEADYANLYASQSEVGGDYFTGSSKFDLSHRWTPLFSTTTSVSFNMLQYVDSNPTGLTNNYLNFIFGNEFRFHTSPRYTWVAEGRYDIWDYYDNNSLNSQTALFLGGLDWMWTRRLTATLRAGAAITSFKSGGSTTSPYFEGSLNYLTSRHSSLILNGRYGYEATNVSGQQNEAYRIGLLYQHAFTSRFSGNAGFNTVIASYNTNSDADSSSTVYDFSAGLQYRLDRHFSIGARYNYTLQDTSTGNQNFDRNRVLFSGQYEY